MEILHIVSKYVLIAISEILIVLCVSCAPVFSDLQSARLVEKNHSEITSSYSALYTQKDEETEHVQNHYGLQIATGLHQKINFRFRIEHARVVLKSFDNNRFTFVTFGLKFGLKKNYLAFSLPVGTYIGKRISTSKSFEISPTLHMTLPLYENKVELNSSFKYIIPFRKENNINKLIALNIGPGISLNLKKWVIRSEVGFLFNLGEEGNYRHISIGLTYVN